LQSASFYAHATLVDGHTYQPIAGIPFKDGICAPLIGDLNVSMQGVTWYYDDEAGNQIKGLKWVLPFGDLSVRREGLYRLQIDVFELADGISDHRGRIFTETFYTYTPKDFPGMGDATEITVHLSKMGIRLRANKTQHLLGGQTKKGISVRFPNATVTHHLLGPRQRCGIPNCPTES
jgi:Velvet factor